ncbi:hypothetical protein CRE_06763 [Caenorhabditis remanei]|uniref:Serine/threonine-protein phosphatase n=1 Tax=Caenorhabditis remanei TaxID=31234 RepID=E3MP04_CAERE|nr:hypothetical protein CRE_06763 [Caenorhabditis remanei]
MSIERKPFEIEKFCKRLLSVKNWKEQSQHVYTRFEIFSVCDLVIDLFRREQTLAEIAPPVRIVGDIHGQYEDLVRLLNCRTSMNTEDDKKASYAFATKKWVFLGDYVDRGFNSLECILLVFSLKVRTRIPISKILGHRIQIVFPRQYILLRGNHETRVINFRYGFRHELLRRQRSQQEANDIWEKFNDAFSYMPLACLVGMKILCMHGGISPELVSLDAIRMIDRPLTDVNPIRLAQDLLWADPDDFGKPHVGEFIHNKNRGLSVCFNAPAVHEACRRLNVCMIVRAHQMMPAGFKFFADRKLCTVFSAPRYMNEIDNRGAVLKVAANGKVSIMVMKKSKLQPGNKPISEEVTKFPGQSEYTALTDIEAAAKIGLE